MEKWAFAWLWLLCINLFGFCMMGIDKRKAIQGKWRVKEASLFGMAFLGGSIGCILGMYVFHHKTRHAAFVWGMPSILLIQLGLFAFLILK